MTFLVAWKLRFKIKLRYESLKTNTYHFLEGEKRQKENGTDAL